ncbi:MAG: complex I NDUFA9 subunit family protein [Verrucomicrobiales bacterium]|nr:complex I NDUFA9 subunit family protein [Verrucomicrobiales bacterium]
MLILVTGGSGFVGREVVGQLQAAGHRLRVLARHTSGSQDGVERIRCSVLEPASVVAAVSGVDAVVHLVGIISEVGDQTFERVHVGGTEAVVSAARAAGVRRYVHMSALGTRPGARSRYHRTKWDAEELVRRSGLDWTILRPSLIYGPGDGFINLFARMSAVSPVLPVVGPGTNQMQPVAVEDVARCFCGALAHSGSLHQTLDVCGRERFSVNEILAMVLETLGRRRGRIHLPWGIAGIQARVLETVYPRLLGKAAPLNRDQILMLQEDNVGDPDPACRMFGFEPVRMREGIRRFLSP